MMVSRPCRACPMWMSEVARLSCRRWLWLKTVSAHVRARANQRTQTGGTSEVFDSLLTPALSRARCRRISDFRPPA